MEAASPCANRKTNSSATAARGSGTASATSGGWQPTSRTFRWRRCRGARPPWRKSDNPPRAEREAPRRAGAPHRCGSGEGDLAGGVGRLAGALARGRLRAAVGSAVADALDGRACAADGLSRRLDRGLTGGAVGLNHAPHNLAALALAIRKLIQQLAR